MKKSIITLLFISISLNIWSDGVLKWKLNFGDIYYGVYFAELELDYLNGYKICSEAKEYCNGFGEAVDNGEYMIEDPCLLTIQFTSSDNRKIKLLVPGIPNEEMVISSRPNSTGYDITGSSFYKQYHEIDLFVEGLQKKYKDEDQIFHEYVEYIKSHPDNDACAMMIPVVFSNHDNIKTAAKALSPQVKNGKVKKYVNYLIHLDETNHSIINLYNFLKVKDYEKINIRGFIIKDGTELPNYSDLFKLKSTPNKDENNIDAYYTLVGNSQNFELTKVIAGEKDEIIPFVKEDGYSKCMLKESLYLDYPVSSSSIFNEIFVIVDKNEAIDNVIEKLFDGFDRNKSVFRLTSNDNRNDSSIKIIGKAKDELNGRVYQSIRYSDGITKITDLNDNWILFKTEFQKDEYTGEYTNTPIDFIEYSSKPAIAAYIKSGRYTLVLDGKKVKFYNSDGVQCILNTNDNILREVSMCFYDYASNSSIEIKKTIEKCFDRFPDLSGTNYIVMGPNGNILEDVTKFKFITLTEQGKYHGGYFDHTTNKMYYISRNRDEGRVMQAWSLTKNSIKINSIYDDDILMIDCLSSDTITQFVNTTNVREIYYSNGDYVKYSKLKRGVIFDCYVHREGGIFTIKRENNNLVAKYDFTDGKFKGYYYEEKFEYLEPKIDALLGYANPTISGLINFNRGTFYNKKTLTKLSFMHGSLYNSETDKYEVLNDQKKQELEEEEKAKQKKQEELQPLYQKYGKNYVDAIMKNNKILIGTPEELIKNHLNSTLKRDGQYSKIYEITGILGKCAATVYVDKKTKKVTSVSYK